MWNIWDGQFSGQQTKKYKISLCTTCMDRLFTLKECLPKNIEDNLDYPNIEFVVLDYNGKDNLGQRIKDNLSKYIDTGILNYFRTEEPKFFSMAHSRNVAFKLASGDIVNNVDADNFTNTYFASYLNKLANECPNKAVFTKGKRLIHGRIGFFREEFINLLGGYDESLVGYGHDDRDLLERAMKLEFKLMWFGGAYVQRIKTPRKLVIENMENKNWRETQNINKQISRGNLENNILKANQNIHWGKCKVIKNFKEEISI